MGYVEIGKQKFTTESVKVLNNVLYVAGKCIDLIPGDKKVQLRGTDVVIDNFKTSGYALIEGSVGSLISYGWASVYGKLSRDCRICSKSQRFYNNTAKESIKEEKRNLRSGCKLLIKLSGSFTEVDVCDKSCDCWLKDADVRIATASGRCSSVSGTVQSIWAQGNLYISKF